MKMMKILFLVLVMILLSSAVIAVTVKSKHQTRFEQHVESTGKYIQKREEMLVAGNYVKIYSEVANLVKDPKLKSKYQDLATKQREKARKAGEEMEAAEIAAGGWPSETLFSSERGLYGFYDYLDAYDDYSGINVYSSLFFEEDWLAKRREMAADYFCEKTLLLGGKECWKSKICESYYYQHDPPAGRNILVAQPTVAGYMPAASIQGERSLPMSYKEGSKTKTGYIYKITYSISNPHRGVLTYHVKLVGDAKTFESSPMTVERSNPPESYQRIDRLGNDPLITESENDYHTVCLTFTPRIRTIHANRYSEICAPIIQYEGAATKPYTGEAEVEGDGEGAGPQEPTDPLSGA